MLAIDTNLLVRYVIDDAPEQTMRARAVIDTNDVFVSVTVVLEFAWVLRSVYRLSHGEIVDAVEFLAGLPTVVVEDPGVLATAFDLVRNGFDFADALHVARADGCDRFVTFDRKLAAAADKVGCAVQLI